MLDSEIEKMAGGLKILAEPNRLRLLELIIQGYQCNCQLSEESGLPANLISHHLGILKDAGLVETERDAFDSRWVYYSVDHAALEQLHQGLGVFCDLERIHPRRLTCGPQIKMVAEAGANSDPTGGDV